MELQDYLEMKCVSAMSTALCGKVESPGASAGSSDFVLCQDIQGRLFVSVKRCCLFLNTQHCYTAFVYTTADVAYIGHTRMNRSCPVHTCSCDISDSHF